MKKLTVLAALILAWIASPASGDNSSDAYRFEPLAFLGDQAPGKGNVKFDFDFEPGSLNNRGDLAFGADLSTGGEGVFLRRQGKLSALARTGDLTPDGKVYGPLFLGHISLNESGNGAFVFHRQNQTPPSLFGQDAVLYRFSPNGTVSPFLLPGKDAPGGGKFAGFVFRPVINNQGMIAFVGLVPTDIGPGAAVHLGQGNFLVDQQGKISKIVRPGDTAPRGDTFDWAQNPWVNDTGDIAFGGHVKEKPCIQFTSSFPAGPQIFCAESVYFRDARTGNAQVIAEQGGSAPGGGVFTYALGPIVNNRRDIAYVGAFPANPPGTGIDPPLNDNVTGIFLHSKGQDIPIARPGDLMPGGGHLVTAGFFTTDLWMNNEGVVSFSATLDSDVNGDGLKDTGLYVLEDEKLKVVARTGTKIPGLGTIRSLHSPGELGFRTAISGASLNERGQIAFQATLEDGRGVLLLATPDDDDDD